jgi:hypothetical protein
MKLQYQKNMLYDKIIGESWKVHRLLGPQVEPHVKRMLQWDAYLVICRARILRGIK